MTAAYPIEAAFAVAREAIAEGYRRQVVRLFDSMVEVYGVDLRGIYNSLHAMTFRYTVSGNLTHTTDRGKVVLYEVSQDLLRRNAYAYADSVIAEGVRKIKAKVGTLQDLTAKSIGTAGQGVAFEVRGTRGADRVELYQAMIVNVSPRGLVFNQWPSRIYVNGKFVSEKAYKAGK